MPGLKGIQGNVPFNLVDELLNSIRDLEDRVSDLEAKQRNEAAFLIKLFGETEAVTASFDLIFAAPLSVDGLYLDNLEAFVSTAGTTSTTVDIFNVTQNVDMLTTNLTILANQKHSSPTYVLNNRYKQVFWKDQLRIRVVTAGSGAKGLGVMLEFQ